MKNSLPKDIKISPSLFKFIKEICNSSEEQAIDTIEKLTGIVREFRIENEKLLNKRHDLQTKIDEFFIVNKNIDVLQVVKKLKEIGFIDGTKVERANKSAQSLPIEITPMAGPQLVVPADKANMVLNAANARWGSLYNALYTSNIIDPVVKDNTQRRNLVIKYTNNFLDKIIQFENGSSWNDVEYFFLSSPRSIVQETEASGIWIPAFAGMTKDGREVSFIVEHQHKLIGINFDKDKKLTDFLLENNGLKIEVLLDKNGSIKDVQLESTLTYIIDLEDASISAPANKYESYRIIKGIKDGVLECEVRGVTRKILGDTTYLDPQTLEKKTLKRTALPLVRDVGPHMLADKEIIEIDGQEVPEKILDCFITSLIGMRFHVAPKMHGAEEVQFNVKLWDAINKAQELPKNINKIGIMNEELRTCAQLANCIEVAQDIIFFTNTGFLDYTGSFIDLMMNAGAIAPYRILATQTYKTEYEKHNVNISLEHNVPQIGAGMWAAISDMSGLLKSKEGQVKGLTDTGWSPSPTASTIHVIAFHLFGNVREMQSKYFQNIKHINIEDLFVFPKADLNKLNTEEKLLNLDFAIHGLLAYAEPWVRRGIGCSGVKDLSGEPLMEDRATARIKAAFVRNWLLHQIITKEHVEDSINRMAMFVDKQNVGVEGYVNLLDSLDEPVITAVHDVIFNPLNRRDSYVEPYFYPAYKLVLNNNS